MQPYIRDIWQRGWNMAQQPNPGALPGVYYGNRVANFSPDQQAAFGGIRDFVQGPGMGYVGDLMSGKYLDAGNPHFAALSRRIGENVIPQVQGAFEGSGRYGGGYNAGEVTRALSDKIGDLAYQDYGTERGYMNQAPGMALGLQGALGASGALQTAHSQAELDAARAKWDEQQRRTQAGAMQPWQQLQMMQGLLGLGQGYNQTTQSTPGTPMWQQALGGAMGAASLAFPQFGMGGMFAPGGFFGSSSNLPQDATNMMLNSPGLW